MLTETSGLSNTWDYNNRLTQAVKGGVTSTYAYDHSGQRVKLANGTTTTYYPSKFYNTDGSIPTKSIYAGDVLIATVKNTGASAAVYSEHSDHLNSTNVTTDSSGAQSELLDYFPFGNSRISSGAYTSQKKYIGQEFDADSGLNYLNARYYNGATGQFISQDPVFLNPESQGKDVFKTFLSDPQTQNSYSYARNNPIVWSDPQGKWFKEYLTGNQSFSDFRAEVGDATLYMGSGWQTAMDNPYLPAIVGTLPLAGYGAAAGLTALSTQYLGGVGTACMAFCGKAAEIAQRMPNLSSLNQAGTVSEKLSYVSRQTGNSVNQILQTVQKSGTPYLDTKTGNVNIFAQRAGDSGYYMVTLNQEMNRVISAGLNESRNVINGIKNGRFVKIK